MYAKAPAKRESQKRVGGTKEDAPRRTRFDRGSTPAFGWAYSRMCVRGIEGSVVCGRGAQRSGGWGRGGQTVEEGEREGGEEKKEGEKRGPFQ
jgi:hypothetical protein